MIYSPHSSGNVHNSNSVLACTNVTYYRYNCSTGEQMKIYLFNIAKQVNNTHASIPPQRE